MNNWVLSVVLCCFVLVGCNTNKTNPAGSALVGRDPGQVITSSPIVMEKGETFQEIVLPVVLGEKEELLVGQMNGFEYRSLLRFRVPVDALSKLSGHTTADFLADSLRIHIGIRSKRLGENVAVSVQEPQTLWEEIATFVDSVQLVEKTVLSTPISGALARVVADTDLVVTLPISVFNAARLQNGQEPLVNLLLKPEGNAEFLLDLIARQAAVTTTSKHPKLVLNYRVGGVAATYTTEAIADTYWGTRINGGPSRNSLFLSRGTFFSPILKFAIPASIPKGATINQASLKIDIDLDRSFYTSIPFEIYHIEMNSAANDTIYTRYNTEQNLVTWQTTIQVRPSLAEAWITGAQVNHGMALRALASPNDMTWVRLRSASLNLIYSLPPEL